MSTLPTAPGLILAAADALDNRAQQICEATGVVWVPVRVQYATAALAAGLRLLAHRSTAWHPAELAALAREIEPTDDPPAQVEAVRPLTLVNPKECR
jgi:hypothetical protein